MQDTTIRLKVDGSPAINPLKQVTKETKKLENAVRNTNGQLKNAKGRFSGVGTGARKAAQGIKALGLAAKSFLGPIGLTLSAVTAVTAGFKGFVEADKARAAVKTLGVDAQRLEMQLTGVVARTKGAASSNQLLAASYDVASAGFNRAADISKILEASVRGASGGMTDIATVSDAATSVMNAYGFSTDKVSKIVDGFIQTQNDGKIVVGQYAGQIGRVAPIASAAGVGLDELNAAISTVTAQGVPVESTFAGIGQVMASILKPTSEAATTAKQLGLEFNTAAIKSKGFAGFLQDVIDKTGGSEVEITKLFGSVDALKALMPLISNDLKTFNKNLENQRNSTGAASDAADIMGQTVSSQLSRIVNSITTLVRGLDQVLGPAIKGILDLINTVITAAVTATAKLSEMFGMNRARAQARKELGGSQGGRKRFADPATEEAIEKRAKEIFQRSQAASTPTATEPPTGSKELQDLLANLQNQAATGANAEDAEKLRNEQLKAGAKLSQQFTRQIKLREASSEIARKELQIEFDRQDAIAEIAATAEISQQAGLNELANEAAILEIEKVRDELAVERQNREQEREKKAAEAAQRLIEADPGYQMRIQLEELIKLENQVAAGATAIGSAFSNAFVGVISGAKSAQQGLAEMMQSVAQHFLDMATKIIAQQLAMILYGTIMKALGVSMPGGGGMSFSDFSGSMSGGNPFTPGGSMPFTMAPPGVADGGRPPVGRPSIVGERGPELFVPRTSGTIIPNHAMGGANVTVNVDASGSNVEGDGDQAAQLGKAIGIAVQQELIKQKRPGGLLTR